MTALRVPDGRNGSHGGALAPARDALARFVSALQRWTPQGSADAPTLDMSRVAPDVVAVVEQMLGEGAVSIRVHGPTAIRVQESVFAGLWRVRVLDAAGAVAIDRFEAAALPSIIVDAARAAAASTIATVASAAAVNAPALLAEIAAQMTKSRNGTHVVNLTLFPLAPVDHAMIERALPAGPVEMSVRGFGTCRVKSTLARDVWRVQYFNAVDALVLNTIEVVDVPEIALAAAEDIDDSRTRLAELVDWMSEACPA